MTDVFLWICEIHLPPSDVLFWKSSDPVIENLRRYCASGGESNILDVRPQWHKSDFEKVEVS